MWGINPRTLILRALLLDWLGQLLILLLIVVSPSWLDIPLGGPHLEGQGAWLLFCLLLYPLLGWLFGSYTVLRWRRLTLPVLLQRLLITGVVTLMVVAIARWLVNPGEDVWLVYRRVQFVWLSLLVVWSLLVRIGLRRGVLLADRPRLLLLASDQEQAAVMRAWRRVPQRERLEPVQPEQLQQALTQLDCPLLVALAPRMLRDPAWEPLCDQLETQDPRLVRLVSPLRLFEQQQERLPPALLPDDGIAYDDLPWAATFSVQAQLKRVADLLVAGGLLLVSAPFIALAAILIWLEDRGPVVYSQQRSGWLGRPFTVFKLRTMHVQPADAPALWTQPDDQRITRVGLWLRRLRLDELPQLLNVLNGEMSLIGPRPERPELEKQLERHIPHYRKRHWMRPGLSGWAQVCAPYASSIEDSDLKLSYDLYYLRHFSTWLDLVILFRTIKTVLKAGGR
ncbi:sugar transferase [Synechococcus sp. BS55D]|uniref:sugar transferase n=1 Tax=Synechococcus sp. BS55D TaxID=2055943 RepID=UPI00103A0292|nr:sugar transferase [Synechococcus sp. BS55D]TCD58104.1 sugar transferase [Synechococcus sp. BS55D]